MTIEILATWIGYILTLIGGASTIVMVLAKIAKVTPSTKDEEVFSTIKEYLVKVQKILGAVSLDTGNTQRNITGK